jgi:hypothetical protein
VSKGGGFTKAFLKMANDLLFRMGAGRLFQARMVAG